MLLEAAGFRQDEQSNVWSFPGSDASARVRAQTVRLCLQKHAELQKTRGSMVWVQRSNEAVIPRPEDSQPSELFGLYDKVGSQSVAAAEASLKERNAEAALRIRFIEKREERGLKAGREREREG